MDTRHQEKISAAQLGAAARKQEHAAVNSSAGNPVKRAAATHGQQAAGPKRTAACLALLLSVASIEPLRAQNSAATPNTPPAPRLSLTLPHSYNPLHAYAPDTVPQPSLANSPKLETLIHDGKLNLSLADAIELALENNLDIAIARYNLPIAEADIERTRAGGSTRGVNTGVVQNTPGGGVGGFGSGAPGAGAGGTTGGAGGAGAGAAGLVSSTLGTGTTVSSYDPQIFGTLSTEHLRTPLSSLQIYGVPSLDQNTVLGNIEYAQAFPTGTSVTVDFDNSRIAQNSAFTLLNPSLNSIYRVTVMQQLLAGFGLGPNLRYLRIAQHDKQISDIAFRNQVTVTITQIADMYWDLVNAYQDEQVKQRSLDFAQQTLASDQKQLALQAIPALDVTKAEGEVAARDGNLSIAKTTLELQQSLIKNALTKNLDDPTLDAVPVIPTDTAQVNTALASQPLNQLIALAMRSRPELKESSIDLENRDISRKSARNAVLPSVALEGYYGGTGLAGVNNPNSGLASQVPIAYSGAATNAFNNSSPDYLVGLNVSIPIRNRLAKSDQYRSELEYRQAQLREQQLRKQIRIEVRNAQYALEQSAAHLVAAQKARALAQQSFNISKQEQKLGSGSELETLAAHQQLALRESDVTIAETTYEKSQVELDRATGQTLSSYHVSLAEAKHGQ